MTTPYTALKEAELRQEILRIAGKMLKRHMSPEKAAIFDYLDVLGKAQLLLKDDRERRGKADTASSLEEATAHRALTPDEEQIAFESIERRFGAGYHSPSVGARSQPTPLVRARWMGNKTAIPRVSQRTRPAA